MIFISADTHATYIDECVRIAREVRDPVTGEIDRDAFVIALGEIADVWPASIVKDVLAAERHAAGLPA